MNMSKKLRNNQFRFQTILESQDLIEIFETLCEIPFEDTMITDTEPVTARHPVIESMIAELQTRIEQDEHIGYTKCVTELRS